MHLRSLVVLVLSAAAASACVEGDLSLTTTAAAIEVCPNFACGQNGPTLNNHKFHELAESHAANLEGFSLGRLYKNGVLYEMQVVGWELRAVSRYDQLTGSELVGSYFEIFHNGDGKSFKVVVKSVSWMQLYAGPLKGTTLPQYVLEWIETTPGVPATHYENLCANPPSDRRETLYQLGESTLLFERNRYDSAAKTVSQGDTNWFNFGCAGHVLSKLLLTGQTTLSSGAAGLSLSLQQATLKALTADYCGDGRAFTVAGEPLYWKTANAFMAFQDVPTSFEGRWSALGPVCLDEPRLVKSTNPLAQLYFPDAPDGTPGVIAAMQQHCPSKVPPACNAAPGAYAFNGTYLVTANPPQ